MSGFTFRNTEQFLPLRLGPTAQDTLQEFIDIDVTAEDLTKILKRNKAYRDMFARFIEQKSSEKKEPGASKNGPHTHRLIGLLGMMGSRNLVIALRMHKAVNGKFPETPDGLKITPSDYLKKSMETEEAFLRAKLEYSETAFTAAVYYDWLIQIMSKTNSYKKTLEPYCDLVWKRAQKTGYLAYFLAKEVKGGSPKNALAAGFFLHGGKILMAQQNPTYIDFETQLEANPKLSPLAKLLLERDKFQTSFEAVSAHSLRYFTLFRSVIPAVANFREPYNLKGIDKSGCQLAALLYLADSMAHSWKIPADEKDPAFAEWAHPSLKQLQLSPKKLIAVMKSAMTLK